MKIQLLTSRAGVVFAQNAGDVIDVSDDEAKRLIEQNQARPIGGKVQPEKRVSRASKKD